VRQLARRLICLTIFWGLVGGSALAMSPPSYMIFFPYGGSEISTIGEYTINQVVDNFRKMRDAHITIVGHTDTAEASVPLSMARAVAAKMRLLEMGIPPDRISTVGRGDKGILVQTPPGTREPQNRRVEFVLQNR
jgi:outer membrane protein OmpA-like peptidoglycan-associated protein